MKNIAWLHCAFEMRPTEQEVRMLYEVRGHRWYEMRCLLCGETYTALAGESDRYAAAVQGYRVAAA